MNRWKKFLKLRRQNDAVKLILLFFLAGVVFWGNVCYNGVRLYRMMSEQAEYVLVVPGAAETADISRDFRKLEENTEFTDIQAMSLQQHGNVTVKYRGQDVPLSYVEVSGEYLEEIYGIRQDDSVKTFYLNQKAWETLGEKKSEVMLNYLAADEQEADNQLSKTARFVKVTEQMPEDRAFVVSRGNTMSLEKYADSIRICLEGEGGYVEALRNQGFVFENTEELLILEQQKELQQMKMKYQAMLGGVCFLSTVVLWKYAKYKQ